HRAQPGLADRHGVLPGGWAPGGPRQLRRRRDRSGGPAPHRPNVVRRLIAAYLDGAGIAVATYGGKLRNPVLLARPEWAGVLAVSTGDVGARPYLDAHPDLVTAVECGDIGRPDDIDTPEDLARVSRALAPAGSAPAHRDPGATTRRAPTPRQPAP